MEERLLEILRIALKYQVSDIHFNLMNDEDQQKLVIEMRVDGEIKQLKPEKNDLKLFRYLMYRADLDLSSAFLPQTGSFEMTVDRKVLSMRFAIVTSYRRSSGVLRILNDHALLHVEELTRDRDVQEWLRLVTKHHTGLVVFSGPTGSGKTTTLYTLLDTAEGKKIFTLEDPIEVVHEGYMQLQINEKQHLSYADGIKQLMRHDPDIVMIGEIRDSEAAVMAVRCALTGHLVVTSLHAQDCVSAILRLLDLGVKDYQLKDVLAGVSNQRLAFTKDGRKTGIYEVMTKEEVLYWFEHQKHQPGFITLRDRLDQAERDCIIAKETIDG